MPYVHNIPGVILGKLAEMDTGSKRGQHSVLQPILRELLPTYISPSSSPPVGAQQAGPWPRQLIRFV